MLAKDLGVYKDSYALFHIVLDIVKILPRDLKYTIGKAATEEMSNAIKQLCRANEAIRANAARIGALSETRAHLETVSLYVRLCYERKAVSHSLFARYTEKSETVGRQVTGWLLNTQRQDSTALRDRR